MAQNDNNNLPNINVDEIKQKISEQVTGLDVNNISANDVKNILMNEINNNKNINLDDSIKQKINNGDVDGLKDEVIKYFSANANDPGSQEIVTMLRNNDMDGLQKKLLGMLFGSLGPQKKNEVEGEAAPQEQSGFGGIDLKSVFGALTEKVFAGSMDDSRVVFLTSMKPFLTETRQKSIDDCVRVMNLVVFFENFNNNMGR